MGNGCLCLRLTIAAAIVLQIQQEVPVLAQGSPLTLQAAVESAHQNNQLIEAARLAITEAQGDLTGASLRLVDNLQVVASAGPRLPGMAGGDTKLQFEVGVEQVFQTGGERDHRINRAQADIGAATALAEDVQRVVDLAVASTFYETFAAEQRLGLLEQNERLARDLHDVALRRLDAGEGTPLELNTARIRLAEVQRRTMGALGTREAGAVRLAELLASLPPRRLDLRAISLLMRSHQRPKHSWPAPCNLDPIWPPWVNGSNQPSRRSTSPRPSSSRPSLWACSTSGTTETTLWWVGFDCPSHSPTRTKAVRNAPAQPARVLWPNRTSSAFRSSRRCGRRYWRMTRRAVPFSFTTQRSFAPKKKADLLQLAFEAGEVGVPDVIVVQLELLDGREGYLDTRLDLALTRARVLAGTYQSQTGPLLGGTPLDSIVTSLS